MSHIDLIGRAVQTRGDRPIAGTVVGVDAASPNFLSVKFSNGWIGSVRADLARAAVARGETPVASVDPSQLTAAARGASAMLNDIRAGKPVPSGRAASVIAEWQSKQSKDPAPVLAEARAAAASNVFKAEIKRGLDTQLDTKKPSGPVVMTLVKNCGRRD